MFQNHQHPFQPWQNWLGLVKVASDEFDILIGVVAEGKAPALDVCSFLSLCFFAWYSINRAWIPWVTFLFLETDITSGYYFSQCRCHPSPLYKQGSCFHDLFVYHGTHDQYAHCTSKIQFCSSRYWAMQVGCLVLRSWRSRYPNPGFSTADDAAAWSIVFVFFQINTFT